MKIRRIQEADLWTVAYIIRRNLDEVMAEQHSPAVIEKYKNQNTQEKLLKQMDWKEIYVVEDHSGIIATGAIASFGGQNKPRYSISNFFVKPELQHKGVGKLLMEHLLNEARKKNALTLHVPSSNNAVAFYAKMGFVTDKIQDDREDEITWLTMAMK